MDTNLTRHQMLQLLEALGHYMDQDLRHKIMRELPLAYNAWMGRTIMCVHVANDGESNPS
jgi:hypothetical protein